MRQIIAQTILAALLLVAWPLGAMAQERPNTILVLDGSGSMWGQIDDINKIVIARDVIAGIVADFPVDQNLGLTVYGHRTRGDCADIETVVAPGIDNREAILDAVNAINPRGKTPMTDAVIAAAEALRFTEEAATVILVSDGIETCNPDPCAAARALEEAGVAFTAHVVGFDVTEADALAQMQCLAEETGGQFLTASNADELAQALTQVATAPLPEAAPLPEPEPIVVTGTFTAVTEADPTMPLADPVIWSVVSDAGVVVGDANANPLTLDLPEGTYRATAYRLRDETALETTFTVAGPAAIDIRIAFSEPQPQASLTAPETAVAGDTVLVGWDGPNEDRDFISVGVPGETTYINYAYTRDGSPATLLMPPTPGPYELRYQLARDTQIIATVPITGTEVSATITAPDTAIAGETIVVDWTGPDYDRDFVSIGVPGETSYINYRYTRDGARAALLMPTEPGSYEIRYQMLQGDRVLATRPITVTEVSAAIVAPDTATAGETITVGWSGPDYDRDYLAVGVPGEAANVNYTYTRDGNPLSLLMPTEPGSYEIRYVLNQGTEVLVTRSITISEVGATLVAPETAVAGAEVMVGWTGPDYDRDYLAVGVPGETAYVNYSYTRDGNPLSLLMPTEPGSYELRYVLNQGTEVLVVRPITVTALKVEVSAPATAVAGATISVAWDGPDYDRDFIAVGLPGEDRYINYAYTREGSPTALVMPTAAGEYEVRYVLSQGNEIARRVPITVTPVTAQIVVPATVALSTGAVIVGWDGPDYTRDFIGLGEPGADRYLTYAYTRDGNPLTLRLPEAPGRYELRYYLGQDNSVLTISPLTVTAE